MDCKTARLLLCFCRPDAADLDDADAEALHIHLCACSECGALADAESQLDARLRRAMRAVPVPSDLPDRLLAQLQQQRRRWYRRHVFWPVGVAAALLLTITAGLLLMDRRIVPNAERLGDEALSLTGAAADQVERWFREQGVITRVPREFNYALLTACQLERFEGVPDVPVLVFRRDNAWAKVYVLSGRRFYLEKALEQRWASGGLLVELREFRDDRHYAYLVLCTGAPLDAFFSEPPVPL